MSGLFQSVVQSIKMCLDYFQNPEETNIAIFTFDIHIHFYSLPQDPYGEPTVLWVAEVQDPFVPYPKDKLVLNVANDRERIDAFLDKLVNLHQTEQKKNMPACCVTGAAVAAASSLL